MSEYTVVASRGANAAGEARGRSVAIPLGTLRDGQLDALAPVELLLAAIAAGVLGGAECAAEALSFSVTAAVVRVRGRYEDGVAPRLAVDYDLAISTDEPDGRLVQFHEFLRRAECMKLLGAVATPLTGCLRRRPS